MKTILDFSIAPRKLYESILEPVCKEHSIAQTELLILMFLADHPGIDTAKEILLYLPFTKSHISMTVRTLEEKGYLTGEYKNGNRRTIHLALCDSAKPLIDEGHVARDKFMDCILKDFKKSEKDQFKDYLERIFDNIRFMSDESGTGEPKLLLPL